MNRLLVVGGSDAGISAALRARELDSQMQTTVVVADRYPNFSICGIPFFLSDEVEDWRSLAHRSVADIEKEGIELLLEHEATAIDLDSRKVTTRTSSGETKRLSFDRLVLATGASSFRPPIHDLSLPGVFFLRFMQDAFEVHRWLEQRTPSSALVVGAGYIGMEMADALSRKKIETTVVEAGGSALQTMDQEFGDLVRLELERHGVRLLTNVAIQQVSQEGQSLRVTGTNGFDRAFDMLIVATGAAPQVHLARSIGLALGSRGAIRVDRRMATSAADVFAAGDCAETYHRLLGRNSYLPLGTTAHKQGRIAGENAAGGSREFAGTLGTQVVKIFDRVFARTGLREDEARTIALDPVSTTSEFWDHKAYYPGATKLKIRLTADRQSLRLLGAQVAGAHKAEVAKRMDLLAMALYHEMKVDALSDLDLSYTPPLSSPWDPVQMAAAALMQTMESGAQLRG